MTLFWLGTHMPAWTSRTNVPLFLSYRQLRRRRTPYPPARGPVVIDSGGFKEIEAHGTWTIPQAQYVADVRRYRAELGRVAWCAIQDWMCEEKILKKTGLSVPEHQARTIQSLLSLRDAAPDVHWAPVIQGWTVDDYLRHVDAYLAAGVELGRESIVGLGSICRRQHTKFLVELLPHLRGIRLHGFGVKTTSLVRGDAFVSADSMAWSYTARRQKDRLAGHTHKNCANCLEYALAWRAALLVRLPASTPDAALVPVTNWREALSTRISLPEARRSLADRALALAVEDEAEECEDLLEQYAVGSLYMSGAFDV